MKYTPVLLGRKPRIQVQIGFEHSNLEDSSSYCTRLSQGKKKDQSTNN